MTSILQMAQTSPLSVMRDCEWTRRALSLLETDQRRSADTHLLHLDVPALRGIDIYLKDESTHPTGSLKHPRVMILDEPSAYLDLPRRVE